MKLTFLSSDGTVAFYREDAEQAEWTQEEMSLLCTFPVDREKIIQRGMTILFQDPATGDWQAYEVRTCSIFPGESYQQMTAESIAISELSDYHLSGDIELSEVTAAAALGQVLPGTGWNIGVNESSVTSFGDIGRGSVWDAVNTISKNWNVYIMPRVTVDGRGITGRYLDIISSEGVWRGLRIAVDKNVPDPCVTYDDSELYTALYGYGATYTEGEGEQQHTVETDFSGVEWSATGSHPAKPYGQKYLEWPQMTALYGRGGKARFGYYQNTEIEDPEMLLSKTWETLKHCAEPKISITGTVTDLMRLGYVDVPLRLHDMAIVDLAPVGIQLYRQVIQLTVNLLDPTGNRPTIGDYIPNIVYINRETEDIATDGGKGAGGGRGGTRAAKKKGEFETEILQNERNIIMAARQIDVHGNILRQAGMEIDPITGVLIYHEDTENMIGAKFSVQANMIQSEVYDRKNADNELSSRITQTANEISLEVSERKNADATMSGKITVNSNKISLVVTEKDGENVVNSASIVAGINSQTGSYVRIKADKINLDGYVTVSQLSATDAKIDNLMTGNTTAEWIKANQGNIPKLYVGNELEFKSHGVYWQSETINGTTYHFMGYVG